MHQFGNALRRVRAWWRGHTQTTTTPTRDDAQLEFFLAAMPTRWLPGMWLNLQLVAAAQQIDLVKRLHHLWRIEWWLLMLLGAALLANTVSWIFLIYAWLTR